MGIYINPVNETKETWLHKNSNSRSFRAPDWNDVPVNEFPVCLVDNGFFTAAAVAYSENEMNAFRAEDGRPKIWYIVDKDKLTNVVSESDVNFLNSL